MHNEINKLFVRMENFWDLLFQLMKYGTNTLHVAFRFLFSIYLRFISSCTDLQLNGEYIHRPT